MQFTSMNLPEEYIIYENITIRNAEDLALRVEEESGGIYAWHLPPPAQTAQLSLQGINSYYSAVADSMSFEYARTERSEISVSLNTTPIKPSAGASQQQAAIKEFICVAGVFSAPVYVGSTDQGISKRIRQHLNGGPYNQRLNKAIRDSRCSDKVYPEMMLVRYLPVDTVLEELCLRLTDEERKCLIEQLEETIFTIRLPALNRKRGR